MDTFSPTKRSWIMAQIKSSGNRSTETNLYRALRENGITGWRRAYPLFGKPDFVFPKARVVVFVDAFGMGTPEVPSAQGV
jgi:DNA mismatch endonuclease (patch repair protein)